MYECFLQSDCLLCLQQRMAEKSIQAIMYTKLLKEGSRQRRTEMGIRNLEADSFHSFFKRHYDDACIDDACFRTVLCGDPPPKTTFKIDYLVIDEAQDLTPELFGAICKIMRDNSRPERCPVLLLGDKRQNIFEARCACCLHVR